MPGPAAATVLGMPPGLGQQCAAAVRIQLQHHPAPIRPSHGDSPLPSTPNNGPSLRYGLNAGAPSCESQIPEFA